MKLYGAPLSNFHNIAKQGLLEKGIAFEEVFQRPSQEAEFLARSPMGKIPCLETAQGCLVETNVILDYLEDTHPNPPLYPKDAYQRAKARELMRVFEHYIDAPARRHIPEILFGAPRNQAALQEAKPLLVRGLNAVKQLAKFGPYIQGEQFGLADIFCFHALRLADTVCRQIYEWDITAEVPGLAEWHTRVTARESSQQVIADQEKAIAALNASK